MRKRGGQRGLRRSGMRGPRTDKEWSNQVRVQRVG